MNKEETNKREVFLTFDVEDFTHEGAIACLSWILKSMRKYGLRGLFFITGSMAEKIANYREVLDLLMAHEIGYHSSSHSVTPAIFEYTDIESYKQAVKISLRRETSQIDPIMGTIDGKGGILFLRELFPKKRIVSYRAPQLCWTPPHLEALSMLGFKFDFSADISSVPVFYKGITFYPYPIWMDTLKPRFIPLTILRKRVTVMSFHPHHFMYPRWDHFYVPQKKPQKLSRASAYNPKIVEIKFLMLESLFMQIKTLQKTGIIRITPSLRESKISLNPTEICVQKIFDASMKLPRRLFGYEPKFLFSHFYNYFSKPY